MGTPAPGLPFFPPFEPSLSPPTPLGTGSGSAVAVRASRPTATAVVAFILLVSWFGFWKGGEGGSGGVGPKDREQ